MHSFVGERPTTRDHTDVSWLVNISWHDADLAFTRSDNTRTVRADQARAFSLHVALHSYHVEHWNSFGNTNDEGDTSIDRFHDRISRKRWWHINHRGIGSGRLH